MLADRGCRCGGRALRSPGVGGAARCVHLNPGPFQTNVVFNLSRMCLPLAPLHPLSVRHLPGKDSEPSPRRPQDALNGASKTVMLVAVTPTVECRDETMCSMQFAQRVRRIDLRSAKRAAQLKVRAHPLTQPQ